MLYYNYNEGRIRTDELMDNALKMGHADGIIRLRKPQRMRKMRFMKFQLSRREQVHKLYQVKIKESKTAVAAGNEKSRKLSDIT